MMIMAVALVVAACGDDDDGANGDVSSQLTAIQTSLANIETSLQRTDVVAAMSFLGGIGFHDIDDEMQEADEIPGGVAGDISNAHAVAASTAWPEDLHELSDELVTKLEEFETALAEDDLQASKTLAGETHAAYHELEHSAYAYIGGEEHSEDDGHSDEEGDDHSEEEGSGG
jgi:hypothetical protein